MVEAEVSGPAGGKSLFPVVKSDYISPDLQRAADLVKDVVVDDNEVLRGNDLWAKLK